MYKLTSLRVRVKVEGENVEISDKVNVILILGWGTVPDVRGCTRTGRVEILEHLEEGKKGGSLGRSLLEKGKR